MPHPGALTLRTAAASLAAGIAYFGFQQIAAGDLGSEPARSPVARAARMGADRAGAAVLRACRLCPGAVPALGAPPRDGGPARAPRQRPLPQRRCSTA